MSATTVAAAVRHDLKSEGQYGILTVAPVTLITFMLFHGYAAIYRCLTSPYQLRTPTKIPFYGLHVRKQVLPHTSYRKR